MMIMMTRSHQSIEKCSEKIGFKFIYWLGYSYNRLLIACRGAKNYNQLYYYLMMLRFIVVFDIVSSIDKYNIPIT
jgi:hypothetical protein